MNGWIIEWIKSDWMNESSYVFSQVVLEEKSFPDITDRAKFLLHGDGSSFWFDKSFNMMVFSDGKCGINAEHAWADAPVMGHLLEYLLTFE